MEVSWAPEILSFFVGIDARLQFLQKGAPLGAQHSNRLLRLVHVAGAGGFGPRNCEVSTVITVNVFHCLERRTPRSAGRQPPPPTRPRRRCRSAPAAPPPAGTRCAPAGRHIDGSETARANGEKTLRHLEDCHSSFCLWKDPKRRRQHALADAAAQGGTDVAGIGVGRRDCSTPALRQRHSSW